jgi:chorismate mutase
MPPAWFNRLLVLLLIVAPGCRPAPPTRASAELLGLMRQRLLLMHDVARWKWNEKRPIADPEREAVLLADVERQAQREGVDAAFARRFFMAQIEAAKVVQTEDHARWAKEGRGRFEPAPDLAGDLRPRIDELNRQLILALKGRTGRLPEHAEETLAGDGISAAACRIALAPLGEPATK